MALFCYLVLLTKGRDLLVKIVKVEVHAHVMLLSKSVHALINLFGESICTGQDATILFCRVREGVFKEGSGQQARLRVKSGSLGQVSRERLVSADGGKLDRIASLC